MRLAATIFLSLVTLAQAQVSQDSISWMIRAASRPVASGATRYNPDGCILWWDDGSTGTVLTAKIGPDATVMRSDDSPTWSSNGFWLFGGKGGLIH